MKKIILLITIAAFGYLTSTTPTDAQIKNKIVEDLKTKMQEKNPLSGVIFALAGENETGKKMIDAIFEKNIKINN